jgi:hypothetical protein
VIESRVCRAPEIGTPGFPHFYGVTHAHFSVASGNPFASKSLGCCEQKIRLAAKRLELVVESKSVSK